MRENHFFCKEEADLYQEIITLMEWMVKKPNNELVKDFFPVMVSGKALVKLDPSTAKLDYKKFITFKPLKNNKHCQFLVELLYEEEDVKDLVTYKQDDGRYGARVDLKDGTAVEEMSDFDTETEAKFCVVYEYFLGGPVNIQDKIAPIKEFDEKNKRHEPPKTNQPKGTQINGGQNHKLAFIHDQLGKKFSGKTSKGADSFITKWYQEAQDTFKQKKKVKR